MKWIKRNRLILLLTVTAFLILGSPLFISGIQKTTFYGIDPDIVYLTNALLYTKYNIISYIDHPGTPTILLLSYLFIPLRILAKFALHKDFIQWSFDNYSFLTYYIRIFMLITFSTALYMFIRLVRSFARHIIYIILSFLLFFSFTGATLAISIVPENISLFLSVIWLSIFYKFSKKPAYLLSVLLTVISGIAFANKFTNLFLVISSILMPLYLSNTKLVGRIIFSLCNTAIAVLFFLFGIFPIINRLGSLIHWSDQLFSHTDQYGTGMDSIFNWGQYYLSITSLISTHPLTFVFILITIFLSVYLLLNKKISIKDPTVVLLGIAIAGVLIFSKYPQIHYNYVNILIVIYCFIYFMQKLKLIWAKVVSLFLAAVFILNVKNYLIQTLNQIKTSSEDKINIMEIWTPVWSSDIFRDQLDKAKKI